MLTTIRNRVHYTPESSQAIGARAAQQRLTRNQAIAYTLAHPNVEKNEIQHQLTLWQNSEPDKWHGSVACQRPGLFKGHLTVRQFHQADTSTLRQCQQETRFAPELKRSQRKVKPPRHGNNPQRDPDPQRLFRSRKAPITLVIEDSAHIRLVNSNTLIVDGMTPHITNTIPADANITTVHIRERNSSIRQSSNRPLNQRSYQINLSVRVPEPEPETARRQAHAVQTEAGHFRSLLPEAWAKPSHIPEKEHLTKREDKKLGSVYIQKSLNVETT